MATTRAPVPRLKQPEESRRAAAMVSEPSIIGRSLGSTVLTIPNGGDQTEQTSSAPSAPAPANSLSNQSNGQWMMSVAQQTTIGVRNRMSAASDQFGHSLRQLYASASSITEVPPSYHNIPGIVPYYHGRSSGPPPSYDEVINPYAAPPTYQSLFGQMREARKTSRGLLDLLRRLLIILVSTLGCTILVAFMILIPFTMIIVGAIYIDECRIEHIPAFLLVGGLVWASKNIIHCYSQCRLNEASTATGDQLDPFSLVVADSDQRAAGTPVSSSGQSADRSASATSSNAARVSSARAYRLKSSICESLLNCVLIGWFIAGCVIVIRNYEPDFDNAASARYCNRTVYMYTFWLIASAISICALFVGCICCLMVSSAIASRQEEESA